MTLFLVVLFFSLFSGLFLSDFLPWWSFVPFTFVLAAFTSRNGFRAFIAGFLAIALLWIAMEAYLNTLSEGRLTQKVATIFGLSSPVILMLAASFLGGLLGGLSAWSGFLLRRAFSRSRR